MKKTVSFLLVLIMLMGVLAISICALETNASSEQGNADCDCGGSYGDWQYPVGKDCQGSRYYRECDSCDSVQTAKDITPKTIPFSVPAIGANAGDLVMLSLYDVYFTSSNVVSADKIVWSSTDIEIVDNQVCPCASGVYKLTATSSSSTKSVYLVVKNPEDTEYVLFLDDFNRAELGDDYVPLEIPSGTEYYISDGKLIMDATVNKDAQMRILLPEWIGDFGDYKIDTSFTMLSTLNDDNSYWFAVMARIQSGDYPFWQAAVRKGAKSHSSGVEIARRKLASGASNGWEVPGKSKYTEDISPDKYYNLTFDISGKTATHAIDGKTLITYKSMSYSAGDVGFHTRASVISIDKIKIVVPIDDSIHSFGDWSTVTADTCTTNGLERRSCENCDVVEERVITGGHKIVSHALKAPSCTESGYRAYDTCERCDYTTFSGEFGPFGHYFDRLIKSVAHRGFSSTAPENTLPAYTLARELGFLFAECDVAFTADGVAVLLHDETIDRTSNGSGKVSALTYEELLQYDFGSWKNAKYAGTKIPTFEEFIALCKDLGMHPYIEIKNDKTYTYSQDEVQTLVDIVRDYDMEDNCTWISFNITYLEYVKNADDTARLGYVSSSGITQSMINTVLALRTDKNEVFLDISYNMITEASAMLVASNGIALETWTVDSANDVKRLPKYISGFTSNKLVASDILVQSTVTEPSCGTQGYTTYTCVCGATKVDSYVPETNEHTYENGACTVCGAPAYCANPEHNLEIIGISYQNGFDKSGVKTVKCLDCNASKTEAVAPALFVCLGYSIPEDGSGGASIGFEINRDALLEYERVTGKTLRYGAFAVSESNIKGNEIFDEDGDAFSGVLFEDVTEYGFSVFHIKVVGFADNQKDLTFAMGAYVAEISGDSSEYSYIQREAPAQNEIYHFISYNAIVNAKSNKEEVTQ